MKKDGFVAKVSDFLRNNVGYFSDCTLYYVKDGGNEWLYAVDDDGNEKRIDITADSEYAILSDLFSKIEKTPWIDAEAEEYVDFDA